MVQLSMYTERTAKLNSITPRMNHGALLADRLFRDAARIKGGRRQIAQDDGRRRQNEIKDSATVVATTTLALPSRLCAGEISTLGALSARLLRVQRRR